MSDDKDSLSLCKQSEKIGTQCVHVASQKHKTINAILFIFFYSTYNAITRSGLKQ